MASAMRITRFLLQSLLRQHDASLAQWILARSGSNDLANFSFTCSGCKKFCQLNSSSNCWGKMCAGADCTTWGLPLLLTCLGVGLWLRLRQLQLQPIQLLLGSALPASPTHILRFLLPQDAATKTASKLLKLQQICAATLRTFSSRGPVTIYVLCMCVCVLLHTSGRCEGLTSCAQLSIW